MRKRSGRYDPTTILLKVSSVISSSLELEDVGRLVLEEAVRALGSDHASLFLTDDKGRHLVLEQAKGFTKDEIENIKILGSWEVINRQLIKKRKSLMINDVHNNILFKKKILPFSRERLPVGSFLAIPLIKTQKVIGALIVSNKNRSGRLFNKDDARLLTALSNYIAAALLNAKLYQDLRELFISTVRSLVTAIDAKDPYTSGHSERVMKYSMTVGKTMGLAETRLENLGLSSLLHDVGKIGVSEDLLSKPGKLSSLEKKAMRLHTLMGVKIVDTIKDADKIIRGIKEHHERFDGKGYPSGLKRNAISLEARIMAVADAFDALTTDRPYRKAYSKEDAFVEICKGSSSQFDPSVIKAFILSYIRQPQMWGT